MVWTGHIVHMLTGALTKFQLFQLYSKDYSTFLWDVIIYINLISHSKLYYYIFLIEIILSIFHSNLYYFFSSKKCKLSDLIFLVHFRFLSFFYFEYELCKFICNHSGSILMESPCFFSGRNDLIRWQKESVATRIPQFHAIWIRNTSFAQCLKSEI